MKLDSRSAGLVLLLALLGLQQLAGASVIQAKARLAQVLIRQAWQQTLTQPDAIARPWPWADTWPVARLRVAELAIDQYVLAGISGNALAFGPGLDPVAAQPGTAGTAVIAGHRDTHFRFLRQLRPGNRLELELASGARLEYRVSDARVVDTRLPIPRPSLVGPSRLQLVTCYPFDALRAGGPLRYVVHAAPVAAEAWAPAVNQTSTGVYAL